MRDLIWPVRDSRAGTRDWCRFKRDEAGTLRDESMLHAAKRSSHWLAGLQGARVMRAIQRRWQTLKAFVRHGDSARRGLLSTFDAPGSEIFLIGRIA